MISSNVTFMTLQSYNSVKEKAETATGGVL